MGGRARLARTLGCFFGSRHGVLNWDVIMPKNWSLAFCRQMPFVWITILAFSRFWASLDFASHEIILGSIGRVWCTKYIDQNLSCYDSVPKWTHLDFFSLVEFFEDDIKTTTIFQLEYQAVATFRTIWQLFAFWMFSGIWGKELIVSRKKTAP